MFLKEEKICYKMVFTFCVKIQSIVRNRVGKLKFKQMKTNLSKRGLATKDLKAF